MYKGETSPIAYLRISAAELLSKAFAVPVSAEDIAVSKKRGCVCCNVEGRFAVHYEAEGTNNPDEVCIGSSKYPMVYPFERAEREAGYVNFFPGRKFFFDACRFIVTQYEVGEMREIIPLPDSMQLAHAELLTYIRLPRSMPKCELSDELCRIMLSAFSLAEDDSRRGDAEALARAVLDGRVNRNNASVFDGNAVRAMAALLNLYMVKQSY